MRVTIRTRQWLLGVLFGLRRGPQVLRDSRTKESSSGVQMTVAEKQSWRDQVREFLKEHSEETPRQKVARLRKVQWTQPRLATLDWLRAIEHQLRWSCGKTLASFHNAAHLEAAVVQPGVVTFPPVAGIKPGASAPVLVVCSDMHSVQTAAAAFLQRKLGLCYEHIQDPHHCSWNATMEGITKAGYGGTVQAMLCIYNISYGPWQRSAFFRHLQTAAQDMSTSLSPDDALLLRQWPHICAERGWATAAQTGHDAREEFLRSLPLDSAAVVKGPKAATSRHSLLGGGGAAERYDPEHVCNLGRKSAPSRSRLRSMSVRGRLPVASPPEGFCRSSASQTSGLISKRARA